MVGILFCGCSPVSGIGMSPATLVVLMIFIIITITGIIIIIIIIIIYIGSNFCRNCNVQMYG